MIYSTIKISLLVLLSLASGVQSGDSHTFFIGTGPIEQSQLDEADEYPDMTQHLNQKLELTKTVTHFRLESGYIGNKRIVVEVVDRKATYIYAYFTKGTKKPTFHSQFGNYLNIYGFDSGDEKGGLLMEKYNYVDIEGSDGEGLVIIVSYVTPGISLS